MVSDQMGAQALGCLLPWSSQARQAGGEGEGREGPQPGPPTECVGQLGEGTLPPEEAGPAFLPGTLENWMRLTLARSGVDHEKPEEGQWPEGGQCLPSNLPTRSLMAPHLQGQKGQVRMHEAQGVVVVVVVGDNLGNSWVTWEGTGGEFISWLGHLAEANHTVTSSSQPPGLAGIL